MANRTVKDATTIKGTNPQYLIEKITRTRIYESKYWKEQCFALSAELLVDKAMELRFIGGVYGGNVKPTPFLCLLLKMLQIQPDKEIVVYFITQQDYKYTRALGAVYLRLTGNSMDCYKYLEPLLLDYRKVRTMDRNGTYQLSHMDEFIDELLHEERSCDIILPRIQKRVVLEDNNQLDQRVSALDDMDEMDTSDEEDDNDRKEEMMLTGSPERRSGPRDGRDWDRPRRSPSPRYRRPPSPHRTARDHHRDHDGHTDRHRDSNRERETNRGRDRDRDRERRRSRSKDRHRHHDKDRDRGDRDRDRDRDRGDKDRDRGDKDRDRDRRKRDKHGDEDRHHHHHKSKKTKRSGKDEEIRLANEQRAKLGLAPLRP